MTARRGGSHQWPDDALWLLGWVIDLAGLAVPEINTFDLGVLGVTRCRRAPEPGQQSRLRAPKRYQHTDDCQDKRRMRR